MRAAATAARVAAGADWPCFPFLQKAYRTELASSATAVEIRREKDARTNSSLLLATAGPLLLALERENALEAALE
jgi:hypothetical protein